MQVQPYSDTGATSEEVASFAARLKERVEREIGNVSHHLTDSQSLSDKDSIRNAHSVQRNQILIDSETFIRESEETLLSQFAGGNEINPSAINPYIVPVSTPQDNDLFRYASLQWSVPVSSGYGRRNKFLLKDRQNGKLIGIFALGDPVINLGPRDNSVGWNAEDRKERLYNVLDAFVLGAVGPYRELLGGKLVALAAISNETRTHIYQKYMGKKTGIREVFKDPTPALITTTSSMGRSSIYNRLTYRGNLMYHPVGYSAGYGHFQFSESLFNELTEFARLVSDKDNLGTRYGEGANWRFRVIQSALRKLGLPISMLRHGVGREVYLAPVASNWDAFLRRETNELLTLDLPLGELAEYFRNRWAEPRAVRKPEYIQISRDVSRISPLIPKKGVSIQQALFLNQEQITIERAKPCVVKLDPYQIEIGIGSNEIEGQSVSGVFGKGMSYFSRLTGPGMNLLLSDTTWVSGERDIQAVRRNDSDEIYDQLIHRLRISISPSTKFPKLSFMEMRIATPDDDSGRATVKKLDRDELAKLIGRDVFPLLSSIRGVIPGTRESLMGDVSRRRSELAVVFNAQDRLVPTIVWTLVRGIALGRQTLTGAATPSSLEVLGVAPENPERFELS
jgi:hypothetical protein